MMILTGKQYVYAKSCLRQKIKFIEFYSKILDIYYAEQQEALEVNKLKTHTKQEAQGLYAELFSFVCVI